MSYAGPIAAIIIPNVGGWAGGYFTAKAVRSPDGKPSWYDNLDKPSWTPPKWVFGPAWTALYSGMGYASYIVYQECGGFTEEAALPLGLYGTQLALNWAWSPLFFYKRQLKWSFYEITALSSAAALTAVAFYRVSPTAGLLLAPYLAWLGFASALNYSIWRRNDGPKAKITEIIDDIKNEIKKN